MSLLLLAAPAAVQAQFTWVTNAGNSVTITGYTGSGGAVAIPPTITGLPVTSIAYPAFVFCGRLTSVTIPNNVTSIGDYAFENCWNLTNLTLGANVSSIGEEAFYGTALTSLMFPTSITSLGDYAFAYCPHLTEVYFQGNAPSAVYLPFHEDPATVYYSPGTAGWGYFAEAAQVQIAPWVPDSLEVNLNPAAAITAGAQWRVDGGAWQNSGAMIGVLTMGSHTVNFSPISGWVTPADQTVFLDTNLFVGIAGTYGQETGSLQVTLTPSPVVTAGTQWQVDGSAWQSSGTTSNLPVGSHTLSFSAVSGWATPVSQAVVVASNQTISATANYAVQSETGALEVTISPSEAVTAGAQWQVDGGTNEISGVTATGLPVGNHNVTFSAIPGWTTPDSQTISVSANSTATAIGTYVAQLQFTNAPYRYITNADNKVTITGYTGPPWAVTIPATINGLAVTSVGNAVFEECQNLTSVLIPDSVTNIGDDAFASCYSLTSVAIGTNVAKIGDSAFYGCSGLASVTIPNSVTSIGSYAFGFDSYEGDSGLSSVTIGTNVIVIGDGAFEGTRLTSVTIPDSVTTIGDSAFYNCYGLSSVTLGSGVTSIGQSAFSGEADTWLGFMGQGDALTSLTIPGSVTNIGQWAFQYCGSLTSVRIGNGLTSIGAGAFDNCWNLARIYFEGNAPADPWGAFYESTPTVYYSSGTSGWSSTFDNLYAVMLNPPSSCGSVQVTLIPDRAAASGARWQLDGGGTQPSGATVSGLHVSNYTLSFSTLSGWTTPANQTIAVAANSAAMAVGVYVPQGQLYYDSFYYVITNNAITIMGYAGSGGGVVIPDTIGGLPVTHIATSAFEGSGLTIVTIPGSVTSIGAAAFEGNGMTSVTIPARN